MTFNIVEFLASGEGEDCAFDQPCRFGHRVEGHAVYCHNDAWKAGPRKCRRTWYTGGKIRDTDCPGFEPNQNPDAAKESVSRDEAMATLYEHALEDDEFISNLAPHKRVEWNAYNRGEGSFTYPNKPEDYIVPPRPPTEQELAGFGAILAMMKALWANSAPVTPPADGSHTP